MLILYHAWTSTCSQKVRLALAEKGLAYEGRLIDLREGEQHAPAFLALNPKAELPVLVHGDAVLAESTIINDYLEAAFPQPALMPASPLARARVAQWNRWVDDDITIPVKIPSFQQNLYPAISRWTPERKAAMIARIANPITAARWRAAAERGFSAEELAEAHGKLRGFLQRLEQALENADWLVEGQLTLADINAFPFVERLSTLHDYDLAGDWPAVAVWQERIRSRPSYAAARFVEQAPA
ncbi:MAG: glutathione S-transferase family protein [Pigmentiphaga sp.]|nr:glutathione S-transferase family protein [Pigmentiphaga sp.]